MERKALNDKVAQFPRDPGVYVMKNAKGDVLYVGKASNLRSRVASYFAKDSGERYQIAFLMSKVADIETLLTNNPKEALLLENTLIKKHRPRYNVVLKDDKSYVSIKLSTKDAFPRIYVTRRIRKDGSLYFGPYTSAWTCREVVDFIETHFKLRTCGDHDFRNRARPCLQFQIQRCGAPCVGYVSQGEYGEIIHQVRLFLEGRNDELKRLVAEQMKTASQSEHFENAARFRDLLAGIERTLEKQRVVSHQKTSRDVFGMYREGERVALYLMMVRDGALQDNRSFHFKTLEEDGDLLASFLTQYYEEGRFIPGEILLPAKIEDSAALAELLAERAGRKVELLQAQRGDKVRVTELAAKNARQAFENRELKDRDADAVLQDLKEKLELRNLPRRMECYDISNFQGKESVGSMVSFVDGKPERSRYRIFKIKSVEGSNDFASLYEVLHRRLQRGLEPDLDSEDAWQLPDLMVIDGGKGQLHAAAQAFKDLGVEHVDLISLAKSRLEGEPDPLEKTPLEKKQRSEERVFLKNRKDPIFFPPNSSMLFLLMQIRDEAHRFGIEHHRKLRKKRTLYSALDDIEGIGQIRRQKLLSHFGSLKRIKAAAPEQISEAVGIPLALAKRVRESL